MKKKLGLGCVIFSKGNIINLSGLCVAKSLTPVIVIVCTSLDNAFVYHFSTLENNGTSIAVGGEEFSLKKTLANLVIQKDTTISTPLAVTVRDITVTPPVSLNITSGKYVNIEPETIIQRGSSARISIDTTIR